LTVPTAAAHQRSGHSRLEFAIHLKVGDPKTDAQVAQRLTARNEQRTRARNARQQGQELVSYAAACGAPINAGRQFTGNHAAPERARNRGNLRPADGVIAANDCH
jgi:hypothetical protein